LSYEANKDLKRIRSGTSPNFFGCDVIHHALQRIGEEFAAIHPCGTGDAVAIS
jgi:hypothetical protein